MTWLLMGFGHGYDNWYDNPGASHAVRLVCFSLRVVRPIPPKTIEKPSSGWTFAAMHVYHVPCIPMRESTHELVRAVWHGYNHVDEHSRLGRIAGLCSMYRVSCKYTCTCKVMYMYRAQYWSRSRGQQPTVLMYPRLRRIEDTRPSFQKLSWGNTPNPLKGWPLRARQTPDDHILDHLLGRTTSINFVLWRPCNRYFKIYQEKEPVCGFLFRPDNCFFKYLLWLWRLLWLHFVS